MKKILDNLKIIKRFIIKTLKTKTPRFLLKVYYSVKIYFLKLDKNLKEMVLIFLKNDFDKVSLLWIHLMFHHLKLIERCGNDYKKLNKYIFRHYCLRFNKKNDLEQLYKIYPENRLMYDHFDENKIYEEISRLMMNILKNKNLGIEKNLSISNINTQDKIQTAIELEYIKEQVNFNSIECIFEIGSGYGRVPEFLLRTNSFKKYFIIDIPPALFLSHQYLKQRFPKIKMSAYSSNLNSTNCREKFYQNDICFISLGQLDLLVDFFANKNNLIIAINCLQEIPEKTIINTFKKFSHVVNYAYIKSSTEPNNPWNDKLLSFDQILNIINWKVVHKQIVKFPKIYKEGIFTTHS